MIHFAVRCSLRIFYPAYAFFAIQWFVFAPHSEIAFHCRESNKLLGGSSNFGRPVDLPERPAVVSPPIARFTILHYGFNNRLSALLSCTSTVE